MNGCAITLSYARKYSSDLAITLYPSITSANLAVTLQEPDTLWTCCEIANSGCLYSV